MSQPPLPSSEIPAEPNAPAEPDVLTPAILRRQAGMPSALSPWAQAHLAAATLEAAPFSLVSRAAGLGGRVQRALPRSLGAGAAHPAAFAAAVVQRTSTAFSAKYAIERKAAPAEGDEAANLPLAYPYGALSDEVAEPEAEAPPSKPNLTFAEMLARVRGQAKPEPEGEPEPAAREAAAPPRAPNATFEEMLALIGRKQGTPQPPAAPAATTGRPNFPAPTAPASVQRAAAPFRRRSQVEEVTPASGPASATAATSSAAATGESSIAQAKAELHAEDEPTEEPWSPMPQAPPAAHPTSAAVQPASRPALRPSRIEEGPAAEASPTPGLLSLQRQAQAGPQGEVAQAEERSSEPAAASLWHEPVEAPRASAPASAVSVPRQPGADNTVPPAPAALHAEPGTPESGESTGAPPLPAIARPPAASIQRETPGPTLSSMTRLEQDLEQAETPVLIQPHGEVSAPLPPPPAAEERPAAGPSSAPAQLAAATRAKPAPAVGSAPLPLVERPAPIQRQPAPDEAPRFDQAAEVAYPAPLPLVERPAPVQRQPTAKETIDFSQPAAAAPAASTPATERAPAASPAPLPLVERPAPVQRQPAAEALPAAPTPPTELAPAAGPAPLPLVERPAPVQRTASVEQTASAKIPAQALPLVGRAPEEAVSPPAAPPEPAAPGSARRKTTPLAQTAEPVEAAMPPVGEPEIEPRLPQTPSSPEALIQRRAAELPLAQRAAPAPAASTAEISLETETPPAQPGTPSLDQAVLARTSAQGHLTISAPPPERSFPGAPLLTVEHPTAAVISRKEIAPTGTELSQPVVQPPAMAGQTQTPASGKLPRPVQPGEERAAEESPVGDSPALPAAWAPVLPQARLRAEARPTPGRPPLPLVPPPSVVMIRRHLAGDELAQRAAETDRPKSEPHTQAAPAPLMIQRATPGVDAPPVAPVRRESEPASPQAPAEEKEEAGASPGVDLDQVAHDLLPMIKRLLAVERERQPRRW